MQSLVNQIQQAQVHTGERGRENGGLERGRGREEEGREEKGREERGKIKQQSIIVMLLGCKCLVGNTLEIGQQWSTLAKGVCPKREEGVR